MRAAAQSKELLEELQIIADVLNGETRRHGLVTPNVAGFRAKLLRLVRAWHASGPNLRKMNVDDELDGDAKIENLEHGWEHRLEIDSKGRAGWMVVPSIRNTPDLGLQLFVRLITNPLCDRLAGPCERCKRYYIKKRASQKVYCSRSCGNAATAQVRTKKRLAEEHADKLRRAVEAGRKWSITHTALEWKQWVAKREPDITPKFLTRAVNRGEISEPKKGR